MRSTTIARAIISAGVLSFLAATPAFAAPPSEPIGNFATNDTSNLTFGGHADFTATVEGKVPAKATIYVHVGCSQAGNVVYLYSQTSSTGEYIFPLRDQAGQGLDWENGGGASCEARLIYRVEKGKSSEITLLETIPFAVAGFNGTFDSALSA
jgi:hypothetical protein